MTERLYMSSLYLPRAETAVKDIILAQTRFRNLVDGMLLAACGTFLLAVGCCVLAAIWSAWATPPRVLPFIAAMLMVESAMSWTGVVAYHKAWGLVGYPPAMRWSPKCAIGSFSLACGLFAVVAFA